MPAFRNIRLCDKDCMCLYVCPTGATDTENSIIDVNKCIPGCRACLDACPAGAISMVPLIYPLPQSKKEAVIETQRELAQSKLTQERFAGGIAAQADSRVVRQFAKAIARSNLIMAEDILRESGFMLAQSRNVSELLKTMRESISFDNGSIHARNQVEFLLNSLVFI